MTCCSRLKLHFHGEFAVTVTDCRGLEIHSVPQTTVGKKRTPAQALYNLVFCEHCKKKWLNDRPSKLKKNKNRNQWSIPREQVLIQKQWEYEKLRQLFSPRSFLLHSYEWPQWKSPTGNFRHKSQRTIISVFKQLKEDMTQSNYNWMKERSQFGMLK